MMPREYASAPLLTIVIPTLNRLPLLKRALASALSQTADVEIVVSDNGSSDGTDQYLKSIILPPHLRLYRHDSTMSVQEHAEFQFSCVRTPWVVFLSDDDFIDAEFAEQIIALIEQNSTLKLIYTGCDLIYDDFHLSANVGPQFERASSFFLNFMEGRRNVCLCASAFRIEDIRRAPKLPADRVIGDMYYWTRILIQNDLVGCVGQRLSYYTFYQPGRSSETNRTQVNTWATESIELAAIMCQSILAYTPNEKGRMARARTASWL